MRVGIVSYWFNRGQAVVSRRIRAALDAAGFTTCVLARPTKGSFVRSGFIDRSGPWAQRGITAASRYEIPEVEYLEWAADNMLDLVLAIAAQGRTVCIVEHNLHVVTELADYAYFMELGRITAEGTVDELTSSPRLAAAYFGTV